MPKVCGHLYVSCGKQMEWQHTDTHTHTHIYATVRHLYDSLYLQQTLADHFAKLTQYNNDKIT